MIDSGGEARAAFWLDVADKVIKAFAVGVGAAWTWMHYLRSRTYAQKLELQLSGSVFVKSAVYVDVLVGLKNLGATRHAVQREGSTCEVVAILLDLSEVSLQIAHIFEQDSWIEPGESIRDLLHLKTELRPEDIVWVRLDVRVLGEGVEWNDSRLLRVE